MVVVIDGRNAAARIRILDKAGVDYELRRNGKLVKRKQSFDSTESWNDHLDREIRSRRNKLSSATSDRAKIQKEIRFLESLRADEGRTNPEKGRSFLL